MSYISTVLISLGAQAQDSGLCNNLSRFSCAPGSYDDGTGRVRSNQEIEEILTKIRAKHQGRIQERWKKELQKEENAYFRDTVLAALGLKNSPDCTGGSANKEVCDKNLIEGISRWTSEEALGALHPQRSPVEKAGNLDERGLVVAQAPFKEVTQELEKSLEKELAQPELEKKIREKIFPQVRDLMVKRLQELPIPDKQKEMMVKKIRGIRFRGTDCDFDSSRVSNLLVPNAYYDANSNVFAYCNGYLLQSSSEFQIAFVIGHELAHAIDPCNIGKGPEDYRFQYSKTHDKTKLESEYPIPNLLSCLRSPSPSMPTPVCPPSFKQVSPWAKVEMQKWLAARLGAIPDW
jgi:hypothetical protein